MQQIEQIWDAIRVIQKDIERLERKIDMLKDDRVTVGGTRALVKEWPDKEK